MSLFTPPSADSSDPPAPSRPVRLLLLSGRPLLRAGVHAFTRTYAQDIVVVEAPADRPDVIVWDGSPAALDAELTEWMGADATPVLLVGHPPSTAPHPLVNPTARLSDSVGPEQFRDAVLQAARGHATPAGDCCEAATTELAPRERQVLDLVAQGLTNREIADHLFVSINSVKTYIRTTYRKIGVDSRSKAVRWALIARGEVPGQH